jgi:hypothetical protein
MQRNCPVFRPLSLQRCMRAVDPWAKNDMLRGRTWVEIPPTIYADWVLTSSQSGRTFLPSFPL